MKIIDVWQPVQQGMDGRTINQSEYYDNYEEAKKQCNGIGISPEPNKLMGLLLKEGEVFLFVTSTPFPLFHTTDDMKKERALAKLTPEERKLLGHD